MLAAALVSLLALTAAARADEAEDQYAVAAGQYARGQWKLAALEFDAYLQKFPQGPKVDQAVFYLAESLLQLGKTEEAAARFGEYLRRQPDGSLARQAMFRCGEAAYLAGHTDEAQGQLERFLAKYPADPLNAYTLAYLGQIALGAKDAATAEKYFRRALEEFPQARNQDECRYGLARALDKLGKAEEAERLYAAVAAKTSGTLAASAQFYLGALQYAQGRFQEAIDTFGAFDTALADSPWRPTVVLGRGWALLKLGRPAEASAAFKSIVADPKVGLDARYWLGLSQKTLKQWNAAAATLLEAAELDPAHKLALSMRLHAADALLHAGDLPAASRQFDEVARAAGPAGELADDALRGKIQVALLTKDHAAMDRLVAEFDGQHRQSPLRPDVQRMYARSLVGRKQYERAAEVLQGLVGSAGAGQDNLEDRYLLSLSLDGLGRTEEALKLLTPVLKSASGQLLADAQWAQATQLMALKRFSEAIAPLEAFLATQPEGDAQVKARGQLAVCYARTNQVPKAKQAYGELVKKYPQHELIVPITEQMAEAAYDAGETSWAEKLFQWLGRDAQAPGYDQRGLSGLGWSQYKAGRLEEAAATLDQLLGKNPDPQLAAEAAYLRGQILEKLGQPHEALVMYDLVASKYGQSREAPDALWAAARLYDSLGQHQQAADLCQRLAKEYGQFPQLDAVLYKWAWILSDMGRTDQSTEVFQRLRRDFPQSRYRSDTTYRLAQRAFDAKQYAQATELVLAVLAEKPDAAIRESAVYLAGQIAAAENKWDEARKAFETLLKDHPQSPLRLLAEYGIAESIFRQRDYPAAIERLRRLISAAEGRTESWLAVAHLRLAQALVLQEQWDEAYAVASKIASRFPGFSEQYEADYVLGRCLAMRASFDAARAAYRKVITSPSGAKTETAAKAQFMIAESYFHQKNYEEALRQYARLEILYAYPTWQAAALLQAGKCHELLGEWKEAVDQYTKLLNTYPQTEFTQEAAKRLRDVQQRLRGSA